MKISHAFVLGAGLNLMMVLSASAVSIDHGLIKKNAYTTDHFSIEFSDLVLDQADEDDNGLPDIVDVIAEAAEHSRDVVIGDLGYPDPMSGTDREIIIILDDRNQYLSTGTMGVTSLLSNGDPYIAIDPWMSDSYLQITVGHEYFHTVQFGYDEDFAYYDQGANWAEATAVWMEDQQYDADDDYVNYIPEYFDYVDYSVFASIVPTGTLFQYGLNVWPTFLAEYFDEDIIKDIWEEYVDSATDYEDDQKLYDAVDHAISGYDGDLRTAYRDFSLWNLDLSQYEEGSSFPLVYILDGDTDQDYQVINEDFAPALFGTNYIYFDNTDSDSNFYFHIVKPEGVSFAVTLVPADGSSVDLSKKQAVILDQEESMDSLLELSSLQGKDGVYAVVSALDKDFTGTDDFDEGYLYEFFAQYGDADEDFSDTVETDASTSEEDSTTDVKEGEAATEVDDDVRVPDSLSLTVVNYDEDSVSFSWNRLTDTAIDSYEIRYGTESDDYTEEVDINRAYITAGTVDGLEVNQKYYFELVALDADNDEVGEPSQEVSVTTEEWIFTDVSYLDDHYDAIAALTDEGIFAGYSNGSFKPDDTINRAELLKILVEGREINPSSSTYKNCFTDVGTEWYAKYVCYAEAQGWVQGYSDGSFKPGNAVNKVEALKILFQVYEAGISDGAATSALSYSDLSQSAWYARYVQEASELGILEETPGTLFNPSDSRTRGEMAEELYRYLVVEGLIKE